MAQSCYNFAHLKIGVLAWCANLCPHPDNYISRKVNTILFPNIELVALRTFVKWVSAWLRLLVVSRENTIGIPFIKKNLMDAVYIFKSSIDITNCMSMDNGDTDNDVNCDNHVRIQSYLITLQTSLDQRGCIPGCIRFGAKWWSSNIPQIFITHVFSLWKDEPTNVPL